MPQTFFSNASQDVHSPLPGSPLQRYEEFSKFTSKLTLLTQKKTCYPHGQHAPTNNK